MAGGARVAFGHLLAVPYKSPMLSRGSSSNLKYDINDVLRHASRPVIYRLGGNNH